MSEMEIPKQTKKMLLLVSQGNPFWRPLLSRAPSQNEISKYIDVGHGTIPAWKNGGQISAETAVDVFSTIKKRLHAAKLLTASDRDLHLKTIEEFIDSYYDDKISVYDTAVILGIPIEQCQIIIDQVIYKRGPVFPRMYYDTKSAANEYFEQYKGIFSLFVKRGPYWLKGMMHVRYILEMGGGFAIRCKLNFPILDADHPDKHWEYDGFLIRRPNRIFWMFEKRQRDRNDQFYFITGIGKPYKKIDGEETDKKERTISGQYLTAGQDEVQSVVADSVLVQRVAYYDPDNTQKTIELMRQSIRVIEDKGECKRLREILAEFELPSKNGEPS